MTVFPVCQRGRTPVSRARATMVVAFLAMAPFVHAARVTPIFDLRFLGGQHFFEGTASDVAGNLDVMFAPAVTFNERWTFIPVYSGNYQGTRDVKELGGGGTLFQDSTSHGLNLKGVWSPSAKLKVKPSVSARFDWLREVEGEKWGEGLFDDQKYSAGLETEYALSAQTSWRAAYDYFLLKFPNYQSLESSQDPTFSRELAGQDVLNNGNHMATLAWRSPVFGGAQLDLSGFYDLRLYADQPVVNSAGSLTGEDRVDKIHSLNLGIGGSWDVGEIPLAMDLGLAWTANDSNQNHYDAKKTAYQQDYYDYSEVAVSPRVTAVVGAKPWTATLGAAWQKRYYAERPTQDVDGNYLSAKMNLSILSTTLAFSYPISPSLRLRVESTLSWSQSNTEYEKVFRYNYRMADYLMGFSYAY